MINGALNIARMRSLPRTLQRGGVLVEAAIALPLFFGLLFVGASAGLLLSSRMVAREGIRIMEREVAIGGEGCSVNAQAKLTDHLNRYAIPHQIEEFWIADQLDEFNGLVHVLNLQLRLTSGICSVAGPLGGVCLLSYQSNIKPEGDSLCQ